MANIQLRFLDVLMNGDFIDVEKDWNDDLISIAVSCAAEGDFKRTYHQILLDKSTAIKFAKTLRTEINKIQD